MSSMSDQVARMEAYYAQIAPRLTNYLVATGSGASGADDLVQETFLRLWKMRDDLVDEMSQVSGLAFTIAKNLRKDGFRKSSHEVLEGDLASGDQEGESVLAKVPAPESSAAGESDRAYLRRRIAAALAQLPPLLSEAYALFQVGELPIREIARRTNATETLVRVRIFRAKEKLQPLLKDLL